MVRIKSKREKYIGYFYSAFLFLFSLQFTVALLQEAVLQITFLHFRLLAFRGIFSVAVNSSSTYLIVFNTCVDN